MARIASEQIKLEYKLAKEDQEGWEKLRKARERLVGLEELNLPVRGKEFLVDSKDVIFLLLANGDVFVSNVIKQNKEKTAKKLKFHLYPYIFSVLFVLLDTC